MLKTEYDGVQHSQAPHTYGMWHQYGILPYEGEGVFMELNNIDLDETMKVFLTILKEMCKKMI